MKNNQGGEETSVIQQLQLFGELKEVANMKDFKRVAGKVGESESY